MTTSSSLTPEQLDEFDHRGVLRLPGLLSSDRVSRAREYVYGRLAALELWRDGAWWPGNGPKPQWPDRGLKASAIGNKHPDVEALLADPALLAAIELLLEERAFDRELFKRPSLLVTLPNADTWITPTGWHVDNPRLASGRRPGVQLFAFRTLRWRYARGRGLAPLVQRRTVHPGRGTHSPSTAGEILS